MANDLDYKNYSQIISPQNNMKLADLERRLALKLRITENDCPEATRVSLRNEEDGLSFVSSNNSQTDFTVDFHNNNLVPTSSSNFTESDHAIGMNRVYESLLQIQERENDELKLQLQELQNSLAVNTDSCTIEKVTSVRVQKVNRNTVQESDNYCNTLTYEEALKILLYQEKSLKSLNMDFNTKENELVKAEQLLSLLKSENDNLLNANTNLQREILDINERYLNTQKEISVINDELTKSKNYGICLQKNMENIAVYKDNISELKYQLEESNRLKEGLFGEFQKLNLLHENMVRDKQEYEKLNAEKTLELEKKIEEVNLSIIDKDFEIEEARFKWNELKNTVNELATKLSANQVLHRANFMEIIRHFDSEINIEDCDVEKSDIESNDVEPRPDSPDSIIELYNSKDEKTKCKSPSSSNEYRSRSRTGRDRSRSVKSRRSGNSRETYRRSLSAKNRRRSLSDHLRERSKSRGRSRNRSNRHSWNRNHSRSKDNSEDSIISSREVWCSSDNRPSNCYSNDRSIVVKRNSLFSRNQQQSNVVKDHLSRNFQLSNTNSCSNEKGPSGLSIFTSDKMAPVVTSKDGNLISTTVEGSTAIPLMLHVGNPGPMDESSPGNFIQKYTISVQKNVPGYHHGSHPVRELDHQCLRFRWPPPYYFCDKRIRGVESQYFCDVKVNGRWFKPQYGSTSPRDAQCIAAIVLHGLKLRFDEGKSSSDSEFELITEMKYILVTGGVISGIGKGIVASSIGALLKACGIRVTSIKIDPYINIDAGTFSPYEHGEVYVLDDGGEVDLDLGNYERFLDVTLHSDNNITTGKIYRDVINRERKGEFLGRTVQVVPHITDRIQKWISDVAVRPVSEDDLEPEICIIELGGTIGDMEGMPFVEALRQFQFRVKKENFCTVHVSLVPQPKSTGEQKTKPTQASVRELRGSGLSPDLIVCRSENVITETVKEKLSNYCQVEPEQVICIHDVKSTYLVPLLLEEQGLVKYFTKRLDLKIVPQKSRLLMHKWRQLADKHEKTRHFVTIALVGKYTNLEDSYVSVNKALQHAAVDCDAKLQIVYIEGEDLEEGVKNSNPVRYHEAWQQLCKCDGILVPGGFGSRGTEGKIAAAHYARTNKKPYLGICLGLQCAVVEFARNVLHWNDAASTEVCGETSHPVVIEMLEYHPGDLGGTMRLGRRKTLFKSTRSNIRTLYGNRDFIEERHRHRWEVNQAFVSDFENAGLKFVGHDVNSERMEIAELEGHPYFVGVQYHPEYLSRPLKPSPPYLGLILASIGKLQSYISRGCKMSPRESPYEKCTSRHKVAIIIPYRDGERHLRLFLNHLHPILQRQQLDYGIYVIEEAGTTKFNRAMLMNIGFVESLKHHDFGCFIFHDVDLLPENDLNIYSCPEQPRHMSVAVDTMNYKLPYADIFGGVSALSKQQMEKVNGFSNEFWGWGGEDDDMSNRIRYYGYKISRYQSSIAKYKMMKHNKDTPNPDRYNKLYKGKSRFKSDGLNSLKYKESGVFEDSSKEAPEELYRMIKSPTIAPEMPDILWINFKCGFPVKVSNEKAGIVKDKLLEMFQYLNDIGHGVICF
ncbi:CTP synthase 1 [Chamberlinius hualienensis]